MLFRSKELQQIIREANAMLYDTQPGVSVSPTGEIQFRSLAMATPAGVDPGFDTTVRSMMKQQSGWVDTVKGNLWGLGGTVQYIDNHAAAIASLIRARAAN